MKKTRYQILSVLLLLIIVMLFIAISVNDYTSKQLDIMNRIGDEVSVSNLSINDYVSLIEKMIDPYFQLLNSGDYEKAYFLSTPEYREAINVDEFSKIFKNMNLKNYHINSIIHKTEKMYLTEVEVDHTIMNFAIILGDKAYFILPEPFLKYIPFHKEKTKDGISIEITGYQINVDCCIFDVTISNNKNEAIVISSNLILPSGLKIESKNQNAIIKGNETSELSLSYQTNLDMPSKLELIANDGKNEKIYEFKLDK